MEFKIIPKLRWFSEKETPMQGFTGSIACFLLHISTVLSAIGYFLAVRKQN